MADYTSQVLNTYNMIKKKGAAITITRTSFVPGDYDATTDTDSAATASTEGTYAVKVNYSQVAIDGTMIQIGDVLFLIPAYDLDDDIDIDDKLTFGSEDYSVVNSKAVDPNGTAILYKVQARK